MGLKDNLLEIAVSIADCRNRDRFGAEGTVRLVDNVIAVSDKTSDLS